PHRRHRRISARRRRRDDRVGDLRRRHHGRPPLRGHRPARRPRRHDVATRRPPPPRPRPDPNQQRTQTMTTTTRLRYTRDELLTDPDYAQRIERNGVLLHGGYSPDRTYFPPRSVHRVPAIEAWTAQLAAEGHPTRVIEADAVQRAFVPNTDQAKMLLRNGASGAMTRILTLIGVVEGFGNDG